MRDFNQGYLASLFPQYCLMPALSKVSKLSKDLGNIRAQLKSGVTRSANPRSLTSQEIDDLEGRRDALIEQMRTEKQNRFLSRINTHTTNQADRVIESVGATVTEATKSSDAFFHAVSGSGSSTDLKVRSKMLMVRANEAAKAERAAVREAAKVEAQKQKEEEKKKLAEQKAVEKTNAKALKDAAKNATKPKVASNQESGSSKCDGGHAATTTVPQDSNDAASIDGTQPKLKTEYLNGKLNLSFKPMKDNDSTEGSESQESTAAPTESQESPKSSNNASVTSVNQSTQETPESTQVPATSPDNVSNGHESTERPRKRARNNLTKEDISKMSHKEFAEWSYSIPALDVDILTLDTHSVIPHSSF